MFNKHLDLCVGDQSGAASPKKDQRCEEVNKIGKGKKRRVTGEILESQSSKNGKNMILILI